MDNISFFNGKFIPYKEAVIPIGTHTFNYGTGCFEGIRGYFSNDNMNIFRLKDHYERMHRSATTLMFKMPYSVEELCDITIELIKKNNYKENIYIRPLLYKTHEGVGQFNLTKLQDSFCIYIQPLGAHYKDSTTGIKATISPWLRVQNNMIPPSAKPTGLYLNTCLAKTEAELKGFDEAILLNPDNTLTEGSAENIFLVKDNTLITPSLDQNILPGITRETIIEIAENEFNIKTEERSIQKDETLNCDEIFLTGTGAEVTPVISIDNTGIGDGKVGEITKKIKSFYFNLVNGREDKYKNWITKV